MFLKSNLRSAVPTVEDRTTDTFNEALELFKSITMELHEHVETARKNLSNLEDSSS